MPLGSSDPTEPSVTIYCFLLGSSRLTWKNKQQTAISRSSTEAELHALASTTTEIIWLQLLLTDFGMTCGYPTPLLSDDIVTI
jgi:hypothetical protein